MAVARFLALIPPLLAVFTVARFFVVTLTALRVSYPSPSFFLGDISRCADFLGNVRCCAGVTHLSLSSSFRQPTEYQRSKRLFFFLSRILMHRVTPRVSHWYTVRRAVLLLVVAVHTTHLGSTGALVFMCAGSPSSLDVSPMDCPCFLFLAHVTLQSASIVL